MLHEQWKALSEQNRIHNDQEVELSTQLQQKEANIASIRDQMTATDESVSDLQDVLLIMTEELEKLEGRKNVLIERKKNASQSKQQLQQTIAESKEQLNRLEQEQTVQKEKLEKAKLEVNDIKQKLFVKEQELSTFNGNIEEEIETLKSDYIELLNKQAATSNEERMLKQQMEQTNVRSGRLDQENAQKFLFINKVYYRNLSKSNKKLKMRLLCCLTKKLTLRSCRINIKTKSLSCIKHINMFNNASLELKCYKVWRMNSQVSSKVLKKY